MGVNNIITEVVHDFNKYDKEQPNQLYPSKLNAKEQDQLLKAIEKHIIEGKSYRQIATMLNMRLSILYNFTVKTPLHSARIKAALVVSATTHAELALSVLEDAPADKFELMRARELSNAHRWLAARKAPHIYGERVDITSGGEVINVVSLGSGVKPPELNQASNTIDITHIEDND